jgi:transcriptional regulator with XRE-family HTH domain
LTKSIDYLYIPRMDARHYNHAQLKSLRELKGLTQKQVAERLKVDRQTVYRVEAGGNVSYELLSDLCDLYGVDVRRLLHPRSNEVAA